MTEWFKPSPPFPTALNAVDPNPTCDNTLSDP